MNRCLYCYRPLADGDVDFHSSCVLSFFGTEEAPTLPYRMDEMTLLAKQLVERSVTVPGVQPKLSMGLIKDTLDDKHSGRLTILDALEGNYILKPQNQHYTQMPENEHLSMRLAELFKIDVVPSTLIHLASGELCYLTKRIDRTTDGNKIHMIDFMQILELEDKYLGTMEQVGNEIGDLSAHTLLDKLRFFELALFNFIIGNNDMHLKNFSMILSETGWVLSPAYDLLNVKIILPKDKDDFALLLGGKKKKQNKAYFERFGEQLNLNQKQVQAVFKRIELWLPQAEDLIQQSFLTANSQAAYIDVIRTRIGCLR